jgi:hypothetical protein
VFGWELKASLSLEMSTMDEKRVEEIFAYIEKSNLDLDYDPISRGPKFLNNMIAECQNISNEIQKFEREVSKEKMTHERILLKLETEYEMRFNDLMSNDPEVAKQPSVKDREAKINDMLSDLKGQISRHRLALTDCGHVESVVKSKLRELKDVNRNLRLQIQLVKDEIQLGNAWGDRSDKSKRISESEMDADDILGDADVHPSDATPEDYDDLFGEGLQSQENSFDTILGDMSTNDPKRENVTFEDTDYDDLLKDL